METKVSYTIVGFFVITLSIVFVIGILWLSVGVTTKDYNTYVVYMHESVSGLSPKSPVKYNGVEVGHVNKISLDAEEPNTVLLTLVIESGTPITIDTRAELDTQGLTGISYVELKGGKLDSPPLKAQPGQKYPVIKSVPSLLFRLDGALSHLTSNLESISKGLSSLLSKKNTSMLSNILQNLEDITDKISENSDKLEDIIEDAQVTLQNTAEASEQLPEVMDNINEAAQNFDELSKNLNSASIEAKQTFRNGSVALETINGQVLPDTVGAFQDVKTILNNLKGVTQQMERNPSVIIRGNAPELPGPGEK